MNKNPSQFLTEVAQLLADAQGAGHMTGLIVIRESQLTFVIAAEIKVGDITIFRVKYSHIQHGLSPEEWYAVVGRLRKYHLKHGFFPKYSLN